MTSGYEASASVLTNLAPTRLQVLVAKPPRQWTPEDWTYAAYRCDEGGEGKEFILNKLGDSYPEIGIEHPTFVDYVRWANSRNEQ